MPPVAWVTLVIAALIIAVTAVGLLRVILHLRHVHFTLGSVLVGVRAIAGPKHQGPQVVPCLWVGGGARHHAPDPHGARGRPLGEREPGPRAGLVRDGLRGART
jgi:hypothetical protein